MRMTRHAKNRARFVGATLSEVEQVIDDRFTSKETKTGSRITLEISGAVAFGSWSRLTSQT